MAVRVSSPSSLVLPRAVSRRHGNVDADALMAMQRPILDHSPDGGPDRKETHSAVRREMAVSSCELGRGGQLVTRLQPTLGDLAPNVLDDLLVVGHELLARHLELPIRGPHSTMPSWSGSTSPVDPAVSICSTGLAGRE